MNTSLRFNPRHAQAASDAWGFNCGPGALCAALNLTPDELRPHLLDFETKHYTNPSLMFGVLKGLNIRHRQTYRSDSSEFDLGAFPHFGLVRIQWDGPWTKPGVPMAARYRKTHWVAAHKKDPHMMIYDVNAMCAGGWISYLEWSNDLIPWLLKQCEPKASGCWWPTHSIEITR